MSLKDGYSSTVIISAGRYAKTASRGKGPGTSSTICWTDSLHSHKRSKTLAVWAGDACQYMARPRKSERKNLQERTCRYIIGKHSFGLPVIHLLYPAGWTPAGIFYALKVSTCVYGKDDIQ